MWSTGEDVAETGALMLLMGVQISSDTLQNCLAQQLKLPIYLLYLYKTIPRYMPQRWEYKCPPKSCIRVLRAGLLMKAKN